MRQEHMIARLLRALSGKTQEEIGEEIGVGSSLIAQFERGKVLPSQEHLERLAKSIGLTVPDAETILRLFQALRDPRFRRGETVTDIVEGLREVTGALMNATYLQMLGVPMPGGPPEPGASQRAQELFQELEALSQEERLAVVQSVEECQSWLLLERVCLKVDQEASRNVESAAAWVEVAQEIAANIQGPEEWRRRVKAYAAEHAAKVPGCLPS